MGNVTRERWSDRDHRVPLLGDEQTCVKCAAPAKVGFTLELDLDGSGVAQKVVAGWSCPLHQTETQDALVQWAIDKGLVKRGHRPG